MKFAFYSLHSISKVICPYISISSQINSTFIKLIEHIIFNICLPSAFVHKNSGKFCDQLQYTQTLPFPYFFNSNPLKHLITRGHVVDTSSIFVPFLLFQLDFLSSCLSHSHLLVLTHSSHMKHFLNNYFNSTA